MDIDALDTGFVKVDETAKPHRFGKREGGLDSPSRAAATHVDDSVYFR
jgi:hypothetical protein